MKREKARQLRSLIEKASAGLSDEDALAGAELCPAWAYPVEYAADKRVRFDGKLYKCRQAHTSQADWTPDAAPSLWSEVERPGDGTRDRPIRYNINMELTEGLYYTQLGVLYLCTRSTGVPVYNDLADLVGLYVEAAE